MCNPIETEVMSVSYQPIVLYPYIDIPTVNGRIYPTDVLKAAFERYRRDDIWVELLNTVDDNQSDVEVRLNNVIGTISKSSVEFDEESKCIKGTLKLMAFNNEAIQIYKNAIPNPVYTLRGVGNLKLNQNTNEYEVTNYQLISVSVIENEGQLK